MNLPKNVSKSTIARNPHLYGAVVGLSVEKRESDAVQALVGQKPREQAMQPSSRPRITIISVRRKPLDDDNLAAAAKRLRDCIAWWITRPENGLAIQPNPDGGTARNDCAD